MIFSYLHDVLVYLISAQPNMLKGLYHASHGYSRQHRN